MNDVDLEQQLHAHGATFRETHQDRAAVDWDAVTNSRRSHQPSRVWAAVGVAVVAAAVAVPLVLVSAGSAPTKPAGYQPGGPTIVVGLSGVKIWRYYLSPAGQLGSADSTSEGNHLVSIAATPDGLTAYGAFPRSACRTVLERDALRPGHGSVGGVPKSPVIHGHPVAEPMALSPDGRKLALVVTSPHDNFNGSPCDGSDELVVVDLQTGGLRRWVSDTKSGALRSLQWAPDSQHLAFTALYTPMVTARIQVLNTAAAGNSYQAAPSVLNPSPSRRYPPTAGYGPVFWWRGQMVTTIDGSLRRLNGHGGVGRVVASHFPEQVDSVSSDPTGSHLLISSGGTTYRWDDGHLMVLKATDGAPGERSINLAQPTW